MLPKRVLVATDGSEYAGAAFDIGLMLARKFSSSMSLLYVVNVRQLEGPFLSDLSGLVGIVPFLNFQNQVREVLYRKGEAVLQDLALQARASGIEAGIEIAEGVVSRIICRTAKSHDIVCLGRHGEHAAWSGLLMGSAVEEVARGSSRPVLVCQGRPEAFRRILLAYDGSRVAGAALAMSVEMAVNLDASLTVLSVTGDPGEAEVLLDEARTFTNGRPPTVTFLHRAGDPVSAIIETSEEGFDMLTMGAYGHGRLRELVLGSTTAGVLNAARIPILLYR